MGQKIELKSIKDLLGMKFFIPRYQRGYRWAEQQVKDLIDDIYEFQQNGSNGIYCIQPLVVKRREEDILDKIKKDAKDLNDVERLLKGSWEVIDGQQRLTTIYILLSYLQQNNGQKYSIEYETRKESNDFLENIINQSKEDYNNIDFFHMYQAYNTIKDWFDIKEEGQCDRQKFLKTLNEKVQFIWYETDEPNPIRVFTRLNIGKIALTDAELIKALFLNRSNFGAENMEQIRLQQVEIAAEWDRIEYTLQNDEFWLFIHDLGWPKPTRIDFIFDLMKDKDQDGLKLKYEWEEEWKQNNKVADENGVDDVDKAWQACIGNDEHQTFRYFYEFFKLNKKKIQKSEIEAKADKKWYDFRLRDGIWKQVKEYFQIFEEWYNDLELYHYIGYLVYYSQKIDKLKNLYKDNRKKFKTEIKKLINRELISRCNDLTRSYGDEGENKRQCFPLLLLFNIQTVINQNKGYTDKYKMDTFYKFPFHLFKKEGERVNRQGWEVEHIASNSGDNFKSDENKKIWLAAVSYCLQDGELKKSIDDFLDNGNGEFSNIKSAVEKLNISPLEDSYKQTICNFALLDSTSNEEYQNDPFPIKRICILTKEQGHKARVEYDYSKNRITIDKSTDAIAFVPPCTKNVFIKAYSDIPNSLSAWTKEDAKAYLLNINDVLSGAGFINDQSQEIEDMLNQNQN